jgi:hypothetical protein
MRTLLAAALVGMALTGRADACDMKIPDHVRILDCGLATAVANAAGRSPALHELLERVQRSDGLVYITPPPIVGPATELLGGLSHSVTTAGPYRVLRIFLNLQPNDRAMAIVGHELRHALEVLELSTARTEADVDALFDRIGWHISTTFVETKAALDAASTIERELEAAKKHRPLDDEFTL